MYSCYILFDSTFTIVYHLVFCKPNYNSSVPPSGYMFLRWRSAAAGGRTCTPSGYHSRTTPRGGVARAAARTSSRGRMEGCRGCGVASLAHLFLFRLLKCQNPRCTCLSDGYFPDWIPGGWDSRGCGYIHIVIICRLYLHCFIYYNIHQSVSYPMFSIQVLSQLINSWLDHPN